MDLERLQQLSNIVALSKEMLSHARQTDWAGVAEIEAGRRKLVMRCFQEAARYDDAPEVAVAIKEILQLNQEVMNLGTMHQQAVGADIHRESVGRTARAAYLGCAR